MTIKKNTASNLGPRTTAPNPAGRPRVADTFVGAEDDLKKMTNRIPTQLHRDFRVVAFQQDIPMNVIVEQLIREYVNKHRES